MRYVSWMWFWYVLMGCVLGGGLVYLWVYLKEKAVKLLWYEWVLFILGIFIFIFLGQTFIASLEEGATQAAWLSVVFMGIPLIVILVASFRSIKARVKA